MLPADVLELMTSSSLPLLAAIGSETGAAAEAGGMGRNSSARNLAAMGTGVCVWGGGEGSVLGGGQGARAWEVVGSGRV
jgi:hypothetical protein